MKVDVEDMTVNVRDAIKDLPNRFEYNKKAIKRLEEESTDLLHLIELSKFNAVEGYKIAKRIQEIRQERRILKDENEELRHIIYILDEMKGSLGKLNNAVGEIRKTKMSRVNRSYRCRVRKDLEARINA